MRLPGIILLFLLLSGCVPVELKPQLHSAYVLPEDKILTRITFGSCLSETEPQPILAQVAANQPDLFIFAGDNVYADNFKGNWLDVPDKSAIQHAYALQAAHSEFAAFAQTGIPVLATWDDHDYGLNDAGGELPLDFKQYSKTALLDFFAVPRSAAVRDRDGLYQSLFFGPAGKRVQIILLDTRWFRSPLKPTDQRNARYKERYLPDWDTGKTMLGAAQWLWLEAEFQRPADIRFVVTSIQLIAEGHGYERWGNLPLEQQKFIELVVKHDVKNLFLLSGDRHIGAFYRRDLKRDLAVYEMTSSALNLSFTLWSDERGPFQAGPAVGPDNFGQIDIDWENRQLHMQLIGLDGTPLRRISANLQSDSPAG